VAGNLTSLAAGAYLYGYPLVADIEAVVGFTQAGLGSSLQPAPFNQFSHARSLAGPDDTFVSVNNDTLYSIAMLDVGAGPLLLDVPDAADRYHVLQFIDAWTNNFAYVGRRASGRGAATYLLTPPGWEGTVPAGATRIPLPTRVATIVGRWACDGPGDLAAVHALQDQLAIRPIDAGSGQPAGVPVPAAGVPPELAFFERLRTWMREFPPAEPEREYQRRFVPLGLYEPDSPYRNAPVELSMALTAGMAAGQERLETLTHADPAPRVNGWSVGIHIFDYNLDHLGPGTIDDPRWKAADRATAHAGRAAAARGGLWGNHGYEAVYCQTFEDAEGERLDGRRSYSIRFDEPPPVEAFWSITMYDIPRYYLVANPINRYSIGDRTPGLRHDDDGSLTITIQHDPPASELRSNWLPAPAAEFRPVMRMYQPGPAVLDGSYRPPPIRRNA